MVKIKAGVVGKTRIDPDQFVTLDHVQISGQDYSFWEIRKFTAIASRIKQCRFSNARIGDASFGSGRQVSEYVECNFDGINIDHVGGHARFVRCSFRDVYIQEWLGQSTELIDCTFSGRLGTAVFCGRIPIEGVRRDLHRDRNEFRGNDFSEMEFTGIDFRGGVDLTQQKLPAGPAYIYVADAARAVARLRTALEAWSTDPEVRSEALFTAHLFEEIVGQGQQQLFLRPDTYYRLSGKSSREEFDKVFSILRAETD
jgi:hypothetical protein